jgi:predicted nuclease of predicted toxin-antitoxin system
VNPLDFPLLADENVHPEVVRFLSKRGSDVQSVAEEGWFGQSDADILRLAHAAGRVVLTHDSDFGTLAIAQGEPFTGIVYLRPGHIRSEFTVETLETIALQTLDVRPPFIVVAARSEQTVRIRVRQL